MTVSGLDADQPPDVLPAGQPERGQFDPAHSYLRAVRRPRQERDQVGEHLHLHADPDLIAGKVTGTFAYTVAGPYVSQFNLAVQGSSVQLVITDVGSSPPVDLPAGAKIVATSTAPSTGG